MLALHWLVQGYGYEITGADVCAAYDSAVKAAEATGSVAETKARITRLVAGEAPGGFVGRVLGRELGR